MFLLKLLLISSLFTLISSYCDNQVCHEALYDRTEFAKNDLSCISLLLESSDSEPDRRAVFYPSVDDVFVLMMNPCADYWKDTDLLIKIGTCDGSFTTDSVHWISDQFLVPLYMAVITLEEGKVTEIAWQTSDNCSDCKDEDSCLDDFCAVSTDLFDTCNAEEDPSLLIKVFLTWKGTDKNGKVLTSVDLSPSALSKYGLNDLVKYGTDIVDQVETKIF